MSSISIVSSPFVLPSKIIFNKLDDGSYKQQIIIKNDSFNESFLFKIKTTIPKNCSSKPCLGLIKPGESHCIDILIFNIHEINIKKKFIINYINTSAFDKSIQKNVYNLWKIAPLDLIKQIKFKGVFEDEYNILSDNSSDNSTDLIQSIDSINESKIESNNKSKIESNNEFYKKINKSIKKYEKKPIKETVNCEIQCDIKSNNYYIYWIIIFLIGLCFGIKITL
jgi:hypothetical protein